MPTRVQVGGKIVEFPDGTPEDVMRKALSSLTPDPAPSSLDMLSGRVGRSSDLAEGKPPRPGIIAGMVSSGRSLTHPGIDTETGLAKSKLATAGDFSLLALPSAIGFEGKALLDAGDRYWRGTKAAARETSSLRDAMTLPVRAYQKIKDALPSSNRAAVDEFLPKSNTYTPPAPTISSGGVDIVDKYLPKVKPLAAPRPPMAKAPTLDEALQTALEQSMRSDQARLSTSAEQVLPGGMQKPKVGKRPGGYTTDIPARGEAPAPVGGEDAVAAEGVTRSPSDARAAKMAETDPGTDSLDALMEALHPGENIPVVNPEGHGTMPVLREASRTKPHFNAREVSRIQDRTGQMLPTEDLADIASNLRRMKGSRDAGNAMFPDLTPGERGELVKKLSPGPSRTPLEAEARIKAAARKAEGNDLPSILMAMLTGGAGAALSSRQTTPSIGELP